MADNFNPKPKWIPFDEVLKSIDDGTNPLLYPTKKNLNPKLDPAAVAFARLMGMKNKSK
jgi:hypothetical protein